MATKVPLGAPGTKFRPPLEQQRKQIEDAILEFRAKGYQCEINIEAFEVQEAGDGEMQAKEIEKLKHQMENCYASARHLEAKLAAMPKPKAKAKGA